MPVLVYFLLAEDLQLNFWDRRLEKLDRVRKTILDADIPDFGEPTLCSRSCFNQSAQSHPIQNISIKVTNHAEKGELAEMQVCSYWE